MYKLDLIEIYDPVTRQYIATPLQEYSLSKSTLTLSTFKQAPTPPKVHSAIQCSQLATRILENFLLIEKLAPAALHSIFNKRQSCPQFSQNIYRIYINRIKVCRRFSESLHKKLNGAEKISPTRSNQSFESLLEKTLQSLIELQCTCHAQDVQRILSYMLPNLLYLNNRFCEICTTQVPAPCKASL